MALTILLARRLTSGTAMIAGLALLPPGLALLVAAQAAGSLAILLVGTVLSGIATALGYRGSLQVANELAPDHAKAEMVSTCFVGGFAGTALPVIGAGFLSSAAGPLVASVSFAATIAVFVAGALVIGVRHPPWRSDARGMALEGLSSWSTGMPATLGKL